MKFKVTLAIAFGLLLFGCENGQNMKVTEPLSRSQAAQEQSGLTASANNNSRQLIGNSNGNNPIRKFIRTADVKFKVKDVVNATS